MHEFYLFFHQETLIQIKNMTWFISPACSTGLVLLLIVSEYFHLKYFWVLLLISLIIILNSFLIITEKVNLLKYHSFIWITDAGIKLISILNICQVTARNFMIEEI